MQPLRTRFAGRAAGARAALVSGLRQWPGRLRADTLARWRDLTRWRVAREVIGVVAFVVGDVWPGYLAGDRPTGLAAVLLAAGGLALMALRLWLPAVALVAAIYLVGTNGMGVVLLCFLSYAAGYRVRSWLRALITVALAAGVYLLVGSEHGLGIDPMTRFVSVSVFGLVVLLPLLFGRYSAQRAALVAALREREERLRRERVMLSRQARLRERNRIAQDMHDSLGHRLSLISVHAGALALDPELADRQRGAVQVLRSAALGAMDELRAVIGVLRRDGVLTGPDGAHAGRGVDAVPELVAGSRRAGASVALTTAGPERALPSAVSHAAYRVVQEALTNAHKHAPGARVAVAVRYEPDALVVEVRNGPARAGTAAPGNGVGLIGLAERVRLAGGITHAGPLPDGGFRVAGVLPYDQPTGSADDPAEDDLPPEPDPGPRRVRDWAGTGSIVAAGLVVLVVVVGFTWLGVQQSDNGVSWDTYESLTVPAPESEVLARLPAGGDRSDDYRPGAPPEPAGATCRYYVATEQTAGANQVRVLRFCFARGELVEKRVELRKVVGSGS